jgi:hypothetical protein
MGCAPSIAAAAPQRSVASAERLAGGNPTNRRVRLPPSWAVSETVSITSLSNKRATFWETAPASGGQRTVWDNLKMCAEVMVNGDMELASSLLAAADLRVPHGDLSVVYDSQGRLYEVPRYAYSNPSNLVTDEEASAALAARAAKGASHVGDVLTLAILLRVSPSGAVSSRSGGNSEQDVKLEVRTDMRVGALKQLLHATLTSGERDQVGGEGMGRPNLWKGKGLPPARQRLMFRGRELRDEAHMQECGVTEAGSVLQVFARPEM